MLTMLLSSADHPRRLICTALIACFRADGAVFAPVPANDAGASWHGRPMVG